MDIDVGGEQTVLESVETVEVVASGDDIANTVNGVSSVGALMDQHMIVANPEGILVPTSEVGVYVGVVIVS